MKTPSHSLGTRRRRRSSCCGLGTLAAFQFSGWHKQSREVADKQRSLDDARAELTRLQAEQKSAETARKNAVDAATAAEQQIAKDFQAALEAARKAIEAKDFMVRLTGPAHIQPGAPNKWQIETLRHGAVGPAEEDGSRRQGREGRGTASARRTTSRSASPTLELPAAFWEKVKPGADLFLEVVAYTDDDRKSVLAERLPARAAGVRHAPRHRQAAVQAGRNDPLPLADARPLHAPAARDTTCT